MNDTETDKNLNAYFESYIVEAMGYCEKDDGAKVRDYFTNAIMDAVFDNLNERRLNEIKQNMSDPSKLFGKVEKFAGEVPGMYAIIEGGLETALTNSRRNPSIVK